MHRLVRKSRIAALVLMMLTLVIVYVVFLYKLQIIEGEKYYNQSNEIKNEERTVRTGNP